MAVQPYELDQAQALVDDALRRAEPRHRQWDAFENLYRHGQMHDSSLIGPEAGRLAGLAGLDLESVNLALPAVNIILESVVASSPELMCEPLSGGDDAEATARLSQAVLRYFWRRTRGTADLRDVAQDMVVLGSGFGKVGWAHFDHEEPREEDEVIAELTAAIENDRRLAELGGRDPSPVDELADNVALTTSVVDRDEPYFEYVSPFDILVPLDARRLAESRWVCQRLTLPKDEVENHPQFSNNSADELKVDALASDDNTNFRTQARRGKDGNQIGTEAHHEVFDTVTIFEFYDMRTRTMLVFQLEADKPLFKGPIPYEHRHAPFVHMRNYSDGGKEFWPFGELEAIANIQSMFNEFTSEQMANARRSGNKYVANSKYVSPELRAILESDQPDVVAMLDNLEDGVPISEIIQAFPRAPLPNDIYEARNDAHGLMREVMGLNDFQTGGLGADRMSATAAAVVDGVATLRAQGKVKQIEEAASHAGNLMLLLCQEYMDERRAIRVTGPNGAAWPEVSADDIRGEFLVSVEGGSTQAVNPATRQQRALDLLTTVVPTIAEAGYDIEPALRSAIRDLGMDPDHILARPAETPPAELDAQGGGASPSLDPAGFEASPQLPPTVPQEDMGGPPIPAATAGDIAL